MGEVVGAASGDFVGTADGQEVGTRLGISEGGYFEFEYVVRFRNVNSARQLEKLL